MARRGEAGQGKARFTFNTIFSRPGVAGRGLVWRVAARQSMARQAWQDGVRLGEARRGLVLRSLAGGVWQGVARRGLVLRSLAGGVWQGVARRGMAGLGKAGTAGEARLDSVRLGEAWQSTEGWRINEVSIPPRR